MSSSHQQRVELAEAATILLVSDRMEKVGIEVELPVAESGKREKKLGPELSGG